MVVESFIFFGLINIHAQVDSFIYNTLYRTVKNAV